MRSQEMPALQEEQLQVLKLLYPWYKKEVFRRREQMMKLTIFPSVFLLLALFVLAALPGELQATPTDTIFALTGVALFSGLFAYLILQQRNRHLMAKQTLIEIERALGLYEKGLYTGDNSLYPEHWQTAWQQDHSVTIYLSVLAVFTILVIAAILLHH